VRLTPWTSAKTTTSARFLPGYEDARHLAKSLEGEAHIGLEGKLANVMVVADDSISVAFSCEEGGSKMVVMGNRPGRKDGGIRRGRSARTECGPITWVSGLFIAGAQATPEIG
jgi:hypothetical protein